MSKHAHKERLTILEAGMAAAAWVTASPHEWKWSQKEQEAMARALVVLGKDLHNEIEKNKKLVAYIKDWSCECSPGALIICRNCAFLDSVERFPVPTN